MYLENVTGGCLWTMESVSVGFPWSINLENILGLCLGRMSLDSLVNVLGGFLSPEDRGTHVEGILRGD